MNRVWMMLFLLVAGTAQAQITNGPSVPDFQSYSSINVDRSACPGTPFGNTVYPNLSYVNHTVAINHSSYVCTIGNPLNIATHVGQVGRIAVTQSAQGNDAIALGSAFVTPGSIKSIVFSTAPGATDYIYYDVINAGQVLITSVLQNATH